MTGSISSMNVNPAINDKATAVVGNAFVGPISTRVSTPLRHEHFRIRSVKLQLCTRRIYTYSGMMTPSAVPSKSPAPKLDRYAMVFSIDIRGLCE